MNHLTQCIENMLATKKADAGVVILQHISLTQPPIYFLFALKASHGCLSLLRCNLLKYNEYSCLVAPYLGRLKRELNNMMNCQHTPRITYTLEH